MIIRTDPMIFLRLQEKDIRWKSPYLLYEHDMGLVPVILGYLYPERPEDGGEIRQL